MKSLFTLFAATLLITGLAACNTVEGFGEDVHNAGSDVSQAARNVDNDVNY